MLLCLLFLAVPSLAAYAQARRPSPTEGHVRRQQWAENPDPAVGGGSDTGWTEMPQITQAAAYPEWTLDNNGAKIPVFQSSGLDQNEVTRAVIVLPGKPRDCWNYWNIMNNALNKATYQNTSVSRSQISIMAPCFWTEVDVQAGAAKPDVLVWGETTWISGHENVGPSGISNYSSYQALDALIAYYMDRSTYPNLNTVVLAGHSAGAQMTQRYAGMRVTPADDDRLHFWIANPGSLMWLSEDRPIPNATCSDFDDYKYGLQSGYPAYAGDRKRKSITDSYNKRLINYAWGTADNGDGDTRCQAETQGPTHYTRGQNFVSMINSTFGWPSNATVDWIEGVSHDNVGMMESAEGLYKLFSYQKADFIVEVPVSNSTTTSSSHKSSSTSKSKHSNASSDAKLTLAHYYCRMLPAVLAFVTLLSSLTI
ncbi:hypothetical protein D9757_013840 [Collybiopsis confluens]|uniref:Uncharacterized protein n=1 Tax=Collybiopsis confluens TaxID=2823264 RepID=A0A8H5GD96_9AGAR|nr:hypothetical protein D9757_013840 [Collybiopsis confluens]